MTVKELLAMEIGAKTGGGFPLTVTTVKKRWQLGDKWIHQLTLTDITGDILANVLCDNNIAFQRTAELHIVVCEIQAAVDTGIKKMFVHEWRQESIAEPPVWECKEPESVVRSKIRCKLVCAYLQSGTKPDEEEVLFWEDFIITGRKR